ncbi:50S ribosomal protein L4 [Candidatus Saccharibacteria bacterium]|nr:50S ribosomal protein L4 [Candidatus Saccharibacteria bacterium]
MATPTFTSAGSKASTPAKLSKDIFDLTVENHDLIKRVYLGYLGEARNAHPNVKTRGLVRGGGRKPWRQKGTGRARFGSIRNPIWTGGGITFGPTGKENHVMSLTKRERQTALKQALSLQKKNIIIIEDLKIKSGKTADVVKLLTKIGAERNTLLVVSEKTEEITRATNNIANVALVSANYVNTNDVMNAYTVVITKPGLEVLNARLGRAK